MTVPAFWLRDGAAARALGPLSLLFRAAAVRRRQAYLDGRRSASGVGAPVVVVGNLFVGGTGKTPLVAWLAGRLRQRGHRPGVIMRGYRGRGPGPGLALPESDPARWGDEAVLLARRTGVPVMVDRDRVRGGRMLVERHGCDVVVADDGLQHYRLARDLEVVVLDAERGLGNGRCLPAGPLREPPERLDSVDVVLSNGGEHPLAHGSFTLVAEGLRPVAPDRDASAPPEPGSCIHAVAGIGNPDRFFRSLRSQGFQVEGHPFPDHHRFRRRDLRFGDPRPVVMTEKDAVKCAAFDRGRLWYQPVDVRLSVRAENRVERLLDGLWSGEEVPR